jgi:uncharacterized Zn finger protein
MTCSCPDWAGMCKHVAAVLYGAGARLDTAPDLLFTLRGVDCSELIAGADLPMTRTGVVTERILAEADVAALFGIEMAPGPLASGVEETKKNVRSVKAAPARRATSSDFQPAKESPAREKQQTKKTKKLSKKRLGRAPTALSARELLQERAGTAAKNSEARTAPEKIKPLNKTVPALAKPAKKTVSSAELSDPQTQAKSRRQNRTKAARWINSRARKKS